MILLDVYTFLARMHPLIIHLPIAFILLAIIFDAVSYREKFAYLSRAVSFTLLMGFTSAVMASVFGYMLSRSGDYSGDILENHKISGLTLTLMTGLLYCMTTAPFKNIIQTPRPVFSALSAATFVLMGYAGHQGANLTHGSNYLTMETLLREERRKPTQVGEAFIFEDIVHPVLEKRCMECHHAGKKKGRLSLESLATVLKGGKSGPSVVPGNISESELYRRITLDPSHDEYMPADGKTPLTEPEKQMIRWWIEKAMAVDKTKITEIKDHQKITELASSLLGLTQSAPETGLLTNQKVNAHIPDTLSMALVDNLREKGVVVRVMLQKPVMLDVTLPARSGKKMSDLVTDLHPLARNIVWLNLSENNFTERDLSILQEMSNLEKLRLERNPVSDGISSYLQGLKYLEAVNLNETKITNEGLDRLQDNQAIKRIYTWKTMCDSQSVIRDN